MKKIYNVANPISMMSWHKIHSTIDQKKKRIKKKEKKRTEINHQHMYKNVQTEIHHSTSSKLKKKNSSGLKSSWQMLAIMYMYNISITCDNLEMFILLHS